MPTTVAELRNSRAQIIAQSRALVDKAETEQRAMSAEEETNFQKAMADADKLKADIEKAERREWVEAQEADLRNSQGRRVTPAANGGTVRGNITRQDFDESVRAWSLAGTDLARHDADTIQRAANCGIVIAAPTISSRALSVGTTTAGGHTVPTNLATELVRKMAFFNPIRQKARSLVTETGANLDYPRVNDTSNTAGIVAEAGTINTNADPAFDKVTLKAWNYTTTIVKVSKQLLADSNVNVPNLLTELFAERMGRGQAAHFVTGNGTTQPEGLATLATVGVNLASGNAYTVDKILDLIYSVNRAYRRGAEFLFNDDSVAALVKLKDSDGQYLWEPSVKEGEPDRLKGYPVDVSESLTTLASPGDNQVLGVFGNYAANYMVRDVGGSMEFIRLNELYAATAEVGFLLMMRTDGRGIGHAGWCKSLNSYDS